MHINRNLQISLLILVIFILCVLLFTFLKQRALF